MKNCETCKYVYTFFGEEPCDTCEKNTIDNFSNWEPVNDQQSKKEQVSILDYVDNKSGVI